MAKIGAFITTHNHPLFLRFSFLQLLSQTTPPQVIVIHENNHAQEYSWAVDDLIAQARAKNIKVLHIVSPQMALVADWYIIPLEALLAEGCDYIARFEHDDIYFARHIEDMAAILQTGCDFVITRKVGLLKLPRKSPYIYDQKVDFKTIHATGGMSGSIVFSRKFAEQNLADLRAHRQSNRWEDQITATETMPKFAGTTRVIEPESPTCCYVAHGGNASSAHWVED